MKLRFTLHGLPDSTKKCTDLYHDGKMPVIRIKECATKHMLSSGFEKTNAIVWFTDAHTNYALNTEAGWRFYNLKKL